MRSRVSEGGHGNGMKWCSFVRAYVRHTARIFLILPNYTTLTSLPHYTALRHVITTPPYRSFRITSSYGLFCTTPPDHPFQTTPPHCPFHITPIHCSFCTTSTTNYHQIYLTTPPKQPRRNALTHPIVKPRLTTPSISHHTIMSHHVHTFHHIIYNEYLYTTH